MGYFSSEEMNMFPTKGRMDHLEVVLNQDLDNPSTSGVRKEDPSEDGLVSHPVFADLSRMKFVPC